MGFSFKKPFKKENPESSTEPLSLEKDTEPAAKQPESKAKRKKGEVVIADSGNVKEVSRVMLKFDQLLHATQEYMSKTYGLELYSSDKRDTMKQLIKQYMKDNNYYIAGVTLADAADQLYREMAEYSFLTPLLARKDIEEININAWNDIQIIHSKGRPYKLSEHFSSPQHALDVVRRMLHNNNQVFDASKPLVTGFLDKNIRISAVHELVVGKDVGVAVSIRIVNPCKITKQQFIDSEMCTEEIYDFLVVSFALGAPQFWQKLASGALTFPHEHFQGVSGLTAPPFDIFASILPNVCDMSERVRSVSRVFLEAICIMFSDISMYIAHIMWLITAETIPDSANNQYILYPSIKDATNTINKPTTHTQKLTITATLFTFVHLSILHVN